MKTLNLITLLTFISLSSFSQTYKIFTAKTSGNWSNANTWTSIVRTDNISQDRYIIPTTVTVVADRDINYAGLGDIQVIVAGTLEMGGSAAMLLSNNSSIQLLTGGVVEGNGASQQILIGGVTKYIGNEDKVIAGPLFADKTTSGFSAFSMLPVQFMSFTASKATDNSVVLKWSTAAEMNNSHFEIEMSVNGRDWTRIGSIHAAQRNTTVNNYSFTHYQTAASMISYRLKQVDKDGAFDYSSVAVIRNNQSKSAQIYTANQSLHIEFSSDVKSNVVVKVLNLNGQVVLSQSVNASAKATIAVNHITKGAYVVQVSDNNSFQSVKKVVLN